MYRLNRLHRNVLCSVDEVIAHAPTTDTPEERAILNAIIIAEERFIVEALSYELYQAIAAEKNRTITLANLAATQDEIFAETHVETTLVVGDIVNSSSFLSADNLALWNGYLWKLAAECILLTAMPTAFVQYSGSGMVHAQPGSNALNAAGAVTPSLQSMKWLIDQVLTTRIDPLIYAMQNYICRNKGNFSTYRNACACDSVTGDEKKHKRTNFVLGIYDQPANKCCNAWDQFGGLL